MHSLEEVYSNRLGNGPGVSIDEEKGDLNAEVVENAEIRKLS